MAAENGHCQDHTGCDMRINAVEKKSDRNCSTTERAHHRIDRRLKMTTFTWVISGMATAFVIVLGMQMTIVFRMMDNLTSIDKKLAVVSHQMESVKDQVKEHIKETKVANGNGNGNSHYHQSSQGAWGGRAYDKPNGTTSQE